MMILKTDVLFEKLFAYQLAFIKLVLDGFEVVDLKPKADKVGPKSISAGKGIKTGK